MSSVYYMQTYFGERSSCLFQVWIKYIRYSSLGSRWSHLWSFDLTYNRNQWLVYSLRSRRKSKKPPSAFVPPPRFVGINSQFRGQQRVSVVVPAGVWMARGWCKGCAVLLTAFGDTLHPQLQSVRCWNAREIVLHHASNPAIRFLVILELLCHNERLSLTMLDYPAFVACSCSS